MPPRVQPHRLPQPSQCQWPSARPQVVPSLHTSSRPFHTTPAALEGNMSKKKLTPGKSTLLRREMAEWLNGPGYKFRRQFPGSTNYLSAYDKHGNLKRKRDERAARRPSARDEEAEEAAVLKQEEEEGIDETERAARAEGRAAERLRRASESTLPKERPSDMHPYPLNPNFRSQSVLSEEMREELYRLVVIKKMDLQGVSAAYGVDMRRVAAVVRLKTIEKQWIEDGTTLAKPYNDAVLAMLPTTPIKTGAAASAHESINDLPVHPATRQQLFYPTSESRQFTRDDAAKVFSSTLLPAEKRIPHPQLVELERWNIEGLSRPERLQRFADLEDKEMAAADEKARKQQEWAERTQRTVEGRRWDFKFQDISSEAVGKHGRSSKGVGYRYGMPHTDRKRGEVKIPTSVE